MAQQLAIVARHPLSRYYSFHVPLPLGKVDVTSLEMGYNYFLCLHHGRKDLAEQLVCKTELKWDATLIRSWVENQGIELNANFIANSDKIYAAIMMYQLDRRSAWSEMFRDLLRSVDDPLKLDFAMCTSNADSVYSCGLRFGHTSSEYKGANHWGRILHNVVRKFLYGEYLDEDLWQQLMNNQQFYLPTQKSALIISDSQSRYFQSIQCGDVVAVSGGRYRDMANVVLSGNFDLASYKWIIFYCGTNEPTKFRYPQHQREADWNQLRDILILESRDRPRRTILFCCAFDHPRVKGNAEHARRIQRDLSDTGVACVNWRDVGNPFIEANGRIKRHLFHADGFHLNPDGARLLFQQWCKEFPTLELFSYRLSQDAKPQAVSKDIFFDDGAGTSRKRKMVS